MCFALLEGDSFLFREEDEPSDHLHVVVTDPRKYDEVLLVSISTMYKLGDRTTILTPSKGQHSFIRQESYVSYHLAKIMSVQGLLSKIGDGTLTLYPSSFPPEDFERIKQGIMNSSHTTERVKRFFAQHS